MLLEQDKLVSGYLHTTVNQVTLTTINHLFFCPQKTGLKTNIFRKNFTEPSIITEWSSDKRN
jgi:hypothetical protein